jgi:hypothetical protein
MQAEPYTIDTFHHDIQRAIRGAYAAQEEDEESKRLTGQCLVRLIGLCALCGVFVALLSMVAIWSNHIQEDLTVAANSTLTWQQPVSTPSVAWFIEEWRIECLDGVRGCWRNASFIVCSARFLPSRGDETVACRPSACWFEFTGCSFPYRVRTQVALSWSLVLIGLIFVCGVLVVLERLASCCVDRRRHRHEYNRI